MRYRDQSHMIFCCWSLLSCDKASMEQVKPLVCLESPPPGDCAPTRDWGNEQKVKTPETPLHH